MRKMFILTAAAALMTLTGCSDSTELGNRAIIEAAAVDYDGKYIVSAMLFSSGGSGGDTIDASQENVIRVTGEGETLAGAIDNISLVDGKRIYMSETKLLILGDGFTKTNAADALKTLYFDMRCSLNMPVCCTENGQTAAEISALKFTEGVTAAEKPLSLIENANRMGVSPKTTLLDLLADSAGNKTSLLPMLSVTENGDGMTSTDDGKTAVLSGSREFSEGTLGESYNENETTALMLISGKTHKLTLNYLFGDEERTCEAYSVNVADAPDLGRSARRVSAKFRTRGGGRLSEDERNAALNALTKLIEQKPANTNLNQKTAP